MRLVKMLLGAVALCAGLGLAGCNEQQASSAASAAFAAFGTGLASVNCDTAPAAAGQAAQQIIKLTVNCPPGADATTCQTLAKDDANAAAAQSLATTFCPAFKGLGNIVIQASVAALDTSKATDANTVQVPATNPGNPKASPITGHVIIDGDKWTYVVPIKTAMLFFQQGAFKLAMDPPAYINGPLSIVDNQGRTVLDVPAGSYIWAKSEDDK